MKHFTYSLAVASLFVASGATATTTLTFESVAPTASYSSSGATITANDHIFRSQSGPGDSGALWVDGPPPLAVFTAQFDALTDFVSVDLGDFNADADTIFLQAFGLDNSSLGFTSLLISNADTMMHTLSISAVGISYVRFGATAPALDGNSVFADNLTWGNAVPEPGTWAMMLLGFGAVGATVRLRKRKLGLAAA